MKRCAPTKEAFRIKEDQALAKLAAADAKYKQSIETTEQMQTVPEKKKKARKKNLKQTQGTMDDQLPSGRCSLYLHFPSTDDYGSKYSLWCRWWWLLFLVQELISVCLLVLML